MRSSDCPVARLSGYAAPQPERQLKGRRRMRIARIGSWPDVFVLASRLSAADRHRQRRGRFATNPCRDDGHWEPARCEMRSRTPPRTGGSTIAFAITGTGVHTIRPRRRCRRSRAPMTIDGYHAAGLLREHERARARRQLGASSSRSTARTRAAPIGAGLDFGTGEQRQCRPRPRDQPLQRRSAIIDRASARRAATSSRATFSAPIRRA